MTLYEIDSKIFELFNTDDLVAEEASKALDKLVIERDTKIENVALYYKNLMAEAVALKAEEESFAKRKKSCENKAEYFKEYLKSALLAQGESKFVSTKASISFRKSEQVQVLDESVIPIDFKREKTTIEIDKAAIKDAIKQGEIIKGAELITNYNIQIK